MTIEIYAILVAVSLLFLFYGWYTKTDLWRLVGCLFLFFIGAVLSPSIPSLMGDLELQTGQTETVVANTTTITYDYTTYQSHSIGWWFSIIGIFGFISVMVDRRSE